MINRVIIRFIIIFSIFAPNYLMGENKSLEHYKQGNIYVKSHHYKQALEEFELAIKENNAFYKAYRNKGLTLFFLTNYQEAIVYLDIALSLEPNNQNNFLIYTSKANAHAYLGQKKEAIDSAKKSILLNKNPINYNTQGAMFGLIGCYQEAIDNYNKAIELDPNRFELYKNIFCPLYKLKRYEEALAACDKAIKLEPNNLDIHEIYANKALVLNKLDKPEEAIESADKALTLNPKNQPAINAKKQALERLKR